MIFCFESCLFTFYVTDECPGGLKAELDPEMFMGLELEFG